MPPPRRPLIAGNWKMNGLRANAERWARAALEAADGATNEVALFPPFPWLDAVGRILGAPEGPVGLGGQACHPEASGAATGSTSAAMLKDVGCRYVLVGHSERRLHRGETDEVVRAATGRAIEEGLVPIVCVGETLEERRAHRAERVVLRQLEAALGALRGPEDPLLVAYEPVWAIGTGLVAEPRQVAEAHGWIRHRVAKADARRAEGLRILYGGSVKPGNIGGLLAAPDVDGALVGGASLDPEAFARLVRAVPEGAPADAGER